MGNLLGNYWEKPAGGQPDFPAFPPPPEGGWETGKRSPGNFPPQRESGKDEVGNFGEPEPLKVWFADELEQALKNRGPFDEIASLLEVAAKQLRRNEVHSAAWRAADAVAMLARKVIAQGLTDVPGVHERTGRGAAIFPPEPEKAMERVAMGDRVQTALYRHFDAAGRLLYVGISLSVVHRLAKHRSASHWFSQIARVDVEWWPTRTQALQAEEAAIKAERPLHNVVMNGGSL